MTTLADDVSLY